jgi:hypothetical protein
MATAVDLPSLTSLGQNAFESTGITRVDSLGVVTGLAANAFYNCKSLEYVKLPPTTENINYRTFAGCTALKVFICEASTPPTLNSYSFSNGATFAIYVPDGSVSAYQSATNWNTHASRIKPLSELPE